MHVICSLCNQGCRNTHTFRMVEVWHGAWFLRVSGCYVILIDFKTLLQRPCAASEVVKLDSKNLEVLLFSCWVKSNSAIPWTAARQASLFFTISWSLLRLISIESVMPSNHFILCHFLPLLLSIFPSIKAFSNELALRIRWPKHWSFSFSPSNEYSGLIFFRIDWTEAGQDPNLESPGFRVYLFLGIFSSLYYSPPMSLLLFLVLPT